MVRSGPRLVNVENAAQLLEYLVVFILCLHLKSHSTLDFGESSFAKKEITTLGPQHFPIMKPITSFSVTLPFSIT